MYAPTPQLNRVTNLLREYSKQVSACQDFGRSVLRRGLVKFNRPRAVQVQCVHTSVCGEEERLAYEILEIVYVRTEGKDDCGEYRFCNSSTALRITKFRSADGLPSKNEGHHIGGLHSHRHFYGTSALAESGASDSAFSLWACSLALAS